MANDFYIEPAGNLMKGLSVLGDALENRTAVIRDKAIKEQAMDIFKNGNPDEMAQFLSKYPEAAKGIEAATNFKNEKTKQNMRDTALNVLLDPDNALDYLLDRHNVVTKEGGDSAGTLAMANLWIQNPDMAKKRAEMALAAFDRPTWESYRIMTGEGAQGNHKLGQVQAIEKDGKQYFAAFVLGPDGKGRTELTPIDGTITKSGETPAKRRAEDLRYKIKEAEATGNIDLANKLKIEVAKTEEEIKRAEEIDTVKGEVVRKNQIIDTGLSAAKIMPSLKNMLRLLDHVKTGGFNSARFKANKWLGIEAPTEGELYSEMGKAVIAKLKASLGTQFTDREGQWLKEIEAGFGSNAGTNRRIILNTLKQLQSEVDNALPVADQTTKKTINNYLKLDLTGKLDLGEAKRPYNPSGGSEPSKPVSKPAQTSPPSNVKALPPAKDHPGATYRNDETGATYKSDGKTWIKVK